MYLLLMLSGLLCVTVTLHIPLTHKLTLTQAHTHTHTLIHTFGLVRFELSDSTNEAAMHVCVQVFFDVIFSSFLI